MERFKFFRLFCSLGKCWPATFWMKDETWGSLTDSRPCRNVCESREAHHGRELPALWESAASVPAGTAVSAAPSAGPAGPWASASWGLSGAGCPGSLAPRALLRRPCPLSPGARRTAWGPWSGEAPLGAAPGRTGGEGKRREERSECGDFTSERKHAGMGHGVFPPYGIPSGTHISIKGTQRSSELLTHWGCRATGGRQWLRGIWGQVQSVSDVVVV